MGINSDTRKGPSFPLLNRASRVLWAVAYWSLFRFSPPPFHSWRNLLLRLFGARIGNGVHVYPSVRIWAPWNLEIRNSAGIGPRAILYSQGKILIGNSAVVSQGAHICTGTHDFNHPGFPLITKPIEIGDNCWVAAEAFVHPGVTMGTGAILAARGVAHKSMDPWTIYAGNPAVNVGSRKPLDNHHL